jgi:hypothetical protein
MLKIILAKCQHHLQYSVYKWNSIAAEISMNTDTEKN